MPFLPFNNIERIPPKEILSKLKDNVSEVTARIKENQQKNIRKHRTLALQPKTLHNGTLKEYQLEALTWMIELFEKGMNGILADDMGLGKTIQTLSFIAYLQEKFGIKGKHLIVAPKNVLRNWQRQAKKWTQGLSVIILPGTQAEREQILEKYVKKGKFDILIVTYQSCQSAYDVLKKKFFWQTLVIDQAHSIKNQETCLANTLRAYKAKFILLLTGTPLSNRLQELWSLLNFIMPDLFSDNKFFRQIELSVNTYEGQEEEKLKYQCEIASNFKKLIQPFMMRRTKNELELGLKEKKQMTLYVSLSQLQLKMYRNFLKFNSVYGQSQGRFMNRHVQLRKVCSHPYIFPQIQKPQQVQCGDSLINCCGKLKLLDKLLHKFIAEKHKVLIFSQFITLLVILEDYCYYRGFRYSKIDGSSSLDERQKQVEAFDNDPDIPVFLISTRAGGLGLNLVSADRVIIYDIDWNPQMDKQAMDRSYRIGQKNSVQVFKLVSANTVEERMIEVQKYKLLWDELVIQKGGLGSLNQSDSNFNKIDYDKLLNLGAQEIFKIQQNFDDKAIQEIIRIGQEKDAIKMKEIRDKLQKDFEKYGKQFNPYEEIKGEKDNLKEISYDAALLKHTTSWREEIKPKIIVEDYKFYKNRLRVKGLISNLNALKEKEEVDEQQIEQIQDKLREEGFFDWTKEQFESFVNANLKQLKDDFNKIKDYIPTKTIEEIINYSQAFYERFQELQKGSLLYLRIKKKQNSFQREIQVEELKQKLKECSLMTLPHVLIEESVEEKFLSHSNIVEIERLDFNTTLENGVCLQECKPVLQDLMPIEMKQYNKVQLNNKKNTLPYLKRNFRKWDRTKTQQKISKALELGYGKLLDQYQDSKEVKKKTDKTKVKKKVDIFEERESESGTEITDKVGESQMSLKDPVKIVSRTKPKN